jgi:diguanylate cyclase (GGDEF)-like protein
VVLLPGVTSAKASEIAERIRGKIAGAPVRFGGEDIAMTASIGVYSLPVGTSATADEVLHQADDALYAAKNAGRNRVHAVA